MNSAVIISVVVESSRCSSKTLQKGSCAYAPLDEVLRYYIFNLISFSLSHFYILILSNVILSHSPLTLSRFSLILFYHISSQSFNPIFLISSHFFSLLFFFLFFSLLFFSFRFIFFLFFSFIFCLFFCFPIISYLSSFVFSYHHDHILL